MSTTVTYKGDTLTTVSNNTKTLKTAGKYMEGDVILTDTSSTILITETYDSGGGIIKTITTTGEINLQAKTVTPTSSVQTINPDTGYDGMSQVTVNASSSSTINNQNKTVTPSESTQSITADSGYTGLGTVTVNGIPFDYVGSGVTRRSSTDITNEDNLVFTIPAGYYSEDAMCWPSDAVLSWEEPNVDSYNNISISVRATTSGYISGVVYHSYTLPNYVGSNITRRSSTDLTVSEATVTVPAGYYENGASKSVTTMTLPTSAASSATSGYTSKATIGRSTAAQYINIPPGYNSAGAYYVISAVANGSATGPTSLSGSSATITTGTNTITLTKTGVTTTPTVSAGYVSSATASTATVALTASVTVNPTPTASGATVTIPAGYYSSQTTKSVTSGSATAPSSISGTAASVSTGTNTLTLTKTVSVTPTVSAGYVSSGTAGNSSVSLTASVTTKAAATITPTTTNQTIAAGTYLTGIQTIAGDADLVGSNILSTANIFGVQGTVVVQNYYTGSSTPSSSLGSNGDLYLQS